jgi:3-oxoacyl-[acyl-carrier-protein] synthase II
MREVVITGIGPILPGCSTRSELWTQLVEGRSQLSFEPAPTDDGSVWPVGRVRDFDPERWLAPLSPRYYQKYTRDQQLYIASLLQAREDARLDLTETAPERVGIFDGTSRGSFDAWYERIRQEGARAAAELYTHTELVFGMPGVAAALGALNFRVRGPVYTFHATCASGSVAIGHAYREIMAGMCDVAFASGHDSALSTPIYHMYRDADLLTDEQDDARRAVRPYVGHSRNAFGEGAVTLVLEERAHAEARGANIIAVITGYSYCNSGEHPTAVDTTGELPAELVNSLLDVARADLRRVSFVVGHGNGVPMSDLSEIAMMRRLFGQRTGDVPLVSTKPIYGHLLGASSALNVAAAALMLSEAQVIPTMNVDELHVVDGMNHQANRSAPRPCDVGLAMSYGLGGQNAALALTTAPISTWVRRQKPARTTLPLNFKPGMAS